MNCIFLLYLLYISNAKASKCKAVKRTFCGDFFFVVIDE